jgi:hypothetical protein
MDMEQLRMRGVVFGVLFSLPFWALIAFLLWAGR